MTEPADNLESRLSSLRPRPITQSLETRIADATTAPVPSRATVGFFWTTIAGGALAASTILVLLTTQNLSPASSRALGTAAPTPQNPNLALASVDWRWGDDLFLNESRRLR